MFKNLKFKLLETVVRGTERLRVEGVMRDTYGGILYGLRGGDSLEWTPPDGLKKARGVRRGEEASPGHWSLDKLESCVSQSYWQGVRFHEGAWDVMRDGCWLPVEASESWEILHRGFCDVVGHLSECANRHRLLARTLEYCRTVFQARKIDRLVFRVWDFPSFRRVRISVGETVRVNGLVFLYSDPRALTHGNLLLVRRLLLSVTPEMIFKEYARVQSLTSVSAGTQDLADYGDFLDGEPKEKT